MIFIFRSAVGFFSYKTLVIGRKGYVDMTGATHCGRYLTWALGLVYPGEPWPTSSAVGQDLPG